MTPTSPKKGFYQILNATMERHGNNEFPIAEVYFKGEKATYYEAQPSKIRLRSLYNLNSIGPKDSVPLNELPKYILHIQDLQILPNIDNPSKPIYKVIWELIESVEYTNHLNEMNSIAVDFMIQDTEDRNLEDSFLADEFAWNEFQSNLVNQTNIEDSLHDDSATQGILDISEDPESNPFI